MIITIRGTFLWRGIGAARLATIQAMFDNELRLAGNNRLSKLSNEDAPMTDLDKHSDYLCVLWGRIETS
jgi:hypothetical protein